MLDDIVVKYNINPHKRFTALLKIMKVPLNVIIFSKGRKINPVKTFEENNIKDSDTIFIYF